MTPLGTHRGRDNVYSRKGYDRKGKITTFYYHRAPLGLWESLNDGGDWKSLNRHVSSVLEQEIGKKNG